MDYSGKNVLIVGAAPDISVDSIEDYDCIVRINKSIPIPNSIKKVTSGRCDVLYVFFSVSPNVYWRLISEVRVRLTPRRYNRIESVYRKFGKDNKNIQIIERSYIDKFNEEVGCKVNTGILAIKEIMDDSPNKLFITGFTFYKTGFHKDYAENESRKREVLKRSGNVFEHDQEKQFEYFINNVYNKHNVHCDEVLKSICEQELKTRLCQT